MTDPHLIDLLTELLGDPSAAQDIAAAIAEHHHPDYAPIGRRRFGSLAEIPVGVRFRDRTGAVWRIVDDSEAELLVASDTSDRLDDLWPYEVDAPAEAATPDTWDQRGEWGIRELSSTTWVFAVPDWTREEAMAAARRMAVEFGPFELVRRTESGWESN
ncbi:hypothetical protein GS504_01025 [Rhodococcus hoagii]|nr:hypothetical protein [Prescottella equi]NKS71747.1 hypothetical protein [Prescottella equi]